MYKYQLIKNSLLGFAVMLSFLCNSQCKLDLTHDATWHGICPNSVIETGDPVFICWGWNNNGDIGKIRIRITHLSGFKDNENCAITLPEVVYDKNVDCNSYTDDSRRICNDISLCPRTGKFSVRIDIALKKKFLTSDCPREEGKTDFTFTVLPDLSISIAQENLITTICPNTPGTYIEIPSTKANQHGADWYERHCIDDVVTDPRLLANSYQYPVSLNIGETRTVFPSYFKTSDMYLKRYSDNGNYVEEKVECKAHGRRVPNTALGAPISTIPPVDPIFRATCNNNPITFEIHNPLNQYDGVKWYDQPVGGVEIHDGFTFTASFPNIYTIIYASYYKSYAEDGSCINYSTAPSPITIVNMTPLTTQALSRIDTRAVREYIDITDYRDIDESLDCNEDGEENNYWINLESQDISNLQGQINQAFEDIINTLQFPIGIADIRVKLSNPYWRAYNSDDKKWETESIFLPDGEDKIVCSDFICKKGESKSKTYQKWADLVLSYSYTKPGTTEPVPASDLTCSKRLLAVKGITSVHPQTTSIDFCTQLTPKHISQYTGIENILDNCDGYKLISACPGTKYNIGPSDSELRIMYASKGGINIPTIDPVTNHNWTPSNGLNDAKLQNPSIWHQDMQSYKGNFSKYTDNISFINTSDAKYCVVIYKCEKCGPIVRDDPTDPIKTLD
tara:strand:+ start:156141 stop:158174 length:2034 start_codon:yes stop_codon:yes gene_type:complete